MKKLNKKNVKKLSIALGAIAIIATSSASTVAMSTIKNNLDEKRLRDLFENPNELVKLTEPDYLKLSSDAKLSANYSKFVTWIKSISIEEATNVNDVIAHISKLGLSNELKLFLLQNYIEKLNIYKTKVGFTKPKITTRAAKAANFNDPSDKARYILDNVRIYEGLPSWDMGEDKAEVDPISKKHFSHYLWELQRGGVNIGWIDGDADNDFRADKVKFTFLDKATGKTEYFYIYYNGAQDTDWQNEDYAFAAIEPSSSNNITTNKNGERVPSIFGLPLDFNEITIEAENSWAHIDNPYMLSFHEKDSGSDDEWGDYLDGIDKAPHKLERREGKHGLYHVAKDVVNYVYKNLNAKVPGFNEVDTDYLYVGNDDSFAYFPSETEKIHISGFDKIERNYHAFDDDRTDFFWSNQTVLNYNVQQITEFLINNKAKIEEILADTTLTTANKIEKIKLDIDKLKMGFMLKEFIKASINSIVLGVFSADWTRPTEAIAKIVEQSGFEIATTKIVKIATNAAVRALVARIVSAAAGYMIGNVVGALAGLIVTSLLSTIPTGNEYSSMDNIEDHGLNDWNFQWKHNYNEMADIAYKWSQDLTHGVQWGVVDAWTSLPELYIQTQDVDGTFQHLSPGSSFNFGNKISLSKVNNG